MHQTRLLLATYLLDSRISGFHGASLQLAIKFITAARANNFIRFFKLLYHIQSPSFLISLQSPSIFNPYVLLHVLFTFLQYSCKKRKQKKQDNYTGSLTVEPYI